VQRARPVQRLRGRAIPVRIRHGRLVVSAWNQYGTVRSRPGRARPALGRRTIGATDAPATRERYRHGDAVATK
jgi:hypothetical protein